MIFSSAISTAGQRKKIKIKERHPLKRHLEPGHPYVEEKKIIII